MMEGSFSSLARAVAILAAIFTCWSLPYAAAIKVHQDGSRSPLGYPAPRAAPQRCNEHGKLPDYRVPPRRPWAQDPAHCGKVPPPSTATSALAPHGKTLQRGVAN